MRQLANFSTTRFANSIRKVTQNVREDFHPVVQSLLKIEKELDGKSGAENKEKLADARRLIKAIFNKDFALKLSGISDLYEVFGQLANEVQTVDLLPFERYDRCHQVIKKFQVMGDNMLHSQCEQNLTEEKNKCAWPLLHKDLKTLELYGNYMGGKIERDYPDRLRNTRFSFQVQNRERAETVSERVTENIEALAKQLNRDLKDGIFTEEVSETIELIRELSDLRELAAKVREHGAVSVGLMLGENFVVNVRKLTNSVDHIPTEALKECYQNFLKAFEKYIEDKEVDNIDRKTVIKDFMRSDDKLYLGTELIIHCLLAMAVKYSVESSVETLISRYEVHFDSSRQLGEEKAHMEMFVSMNGPVLVRADPLLKRAMDKFFKDKNPRGDGAWHMYHSDETRFYPQDESQTIRRLQKEKNKLGFVDEEQ